MDMGSISAAVTSLRAASEIVKTIASLHTAGEIQAKAVELNQKILDAQHQVFEANAAQSALLEQVRQLEAELTRAKDWEKQRERYKLVAPFPGCMVYALQKSHSDDEPPHYICPACFQQGRKSILQSRPGAGSGIRFAHLKCTACALKALTPYYQVGAPKYFEDIVPVA